MAVGLWLSAAERQAARRTVDEIVLLGRERAQGLLTGRLAPPLMSDMENRPASRRNVGARLT